MAKTLANLAGLRFNRWTVLEQAPSDAKYQGRHKCVCDCGTVKIVYSYALKNGTSKSCGCHRSEVGTKLGHESKTHGHSESSTYKSWRAMKSRCLNPNDPNFEHYGLMGVTVCDKWMEFEGFLEDMGERPEGLSLDRINPWKNYEKANCRWADSATQKRNTRQNALKESITCLL